MGEVLFGRDLARSLPKDQPFYGLQARGVLHGAEFDSTIEDMARRYLDEVTAIQPTGPYYLGGFCMGGLVAYEMAQQLAAQGRTTAIVVMIETYNPVEVEKAGGRADAFTLFREKVRFQVGNLRGLPAKERARYASVRLQAMAHGILHRWRGRLARWIQPDAAVAVNNDESNPLLEEINDRAGMVYQPKPYAGRVLVVRPKNGYSFYHEPTLGWTTYVSGPLDVITIPVNPGGMLVEPFVSLVAQGIGEALERTHG